MSDAITSRYPNAEWTHRGILCHARFRRGGWYCGYIAVPPQHPWYGKDERGVDADVHGCLTYAEGEPPGFSAPPGLWWLGFDCAHVGDAYAPEPNRSCPIQPSPREWALVNALRRQRGYPDDPNGHFWTLDDVRAETNRLADQAVQAAELATHAEVPDV